MEKEKKDKRKEDKQVEEDDDELFTDEFLQDEASNPFIEASKDFTVNDFNPFKKIHSLKFTLSNTKFSVLI